MTFGNTTRIYVISGFASREAVLFGGERFAWVICDKYSSLYIIDNRMFLSLCDNIIIVPSERELGERN